MIRMVSMLPSRRRRSNRDGFITTIVIVEALASSVWAGRGRDSTSLLLGVEGLLGDSRPCRLSRAELG